MGFPEVYDYAPSKVDWMARGLPLEGERATERRALDYARPDVVTCGLHDRLGPLRARVERSPYRFALVLSGDGVLLGRVGQTALAGDPERAAGEVLAPGPSTDRPNVAPDKLLAKLKGAERSSAILTDPDGRLLGVVHRDDLEQALND